MKKMKAFINVFQKRNWTKKQNKRELRNSKQTKFKKLNR